MASRSPLWPAQLDHIRIDSDDPQALSAFYRDILGMTPLGLTDGSVIMQGAGRRIVLGRGKPGDQPFSAFRVQSPQQLADLRAHLATQGVAILASPTKVFADGAFAVRDPDGRLAAFGLPRTDLPSGDHLARPASAALPGRLQHVVVASRDLQAMMDFYLGALGFTPSDYVQQGANRENTVCFMRSDPEHHSFAVFRAPEARPDHHAYEANCWNDIRDWADHLSRHDLQIWWGPGRHGPGNNLFFMAKDPLGYLFEISAELEIMPREMAPRVWEHSERTVNLWGKGWLRS